ncbi:hypothetical protein K490DRAFT_62844 [Saccharata proteae CBS 121410]|uniref:RRM domain-containing protein n=1 Tax=Saccharata proteae CBS 121410 TaxID=1314787 RepID=A0A9P4I140_9PEZI|nr:hypothetical protein K490DRAFT_62844 [Saccharata proteae CBS 121410]
MDFQARSMSNPAVMGSSVLPGTPTLSPASTHVATTVEEGSAPSTPPSAKLGEDAQLLHPNSAASSPLEAIFGDVLTTKPKYKHKSHHSLSSSDSSPSRVLGMAQILSSFGEDTEHKPFVQGSRLEDDVFGIAMNSNGSPLVDVEDAQPAAKDEANPRHDPGSQLITGENAQAYWKPEACVFVANLLRSADNADLAIAVKENFNKFGECWVKIKRDGKMPVAFVQFCNAQHSAMALEQGAGMLIMGRACRTERCKAPRIVYVSRRDGQVPSAEEIRLLLLNQGELEKIWYPSETERELHRLPVGCFVRFAYYDTSIQAVKYFRGNSTHHVQHYPQQKHHNPAFDRSTLQHRPSATYFAPPFHPARHENRRFHGRGLQGRMMRTDQPGHFGGHRQQMSYVDPRARNAFPFDQRFLNWPAHHYPGYNVSHLNNGHPNQVPYAYIQQAPHTGTSVHANPEYGSNAHHNRHRVFHAHYILQDGVPVPARGPRNDGSIPAGHGHVVNGNRAQIGNPGLRTHGNGRTANASHYGTSTGGNVTGPGQMLHPGFQGQVYMPQYAPVQMPVAPGGYRFGPYPPQWY